MTNPLRARQSLLAKSTIAAIDKLLDEAAQARKPAPGLLEARDAMQFCITQNAIYDEHESDHSGWAEQGLIGALILDSGAWFKVKDKITEADFALDCHRRIFRHIYKLIAILHPVDIVTLWESICAANEGDQCMGLSYIGEIAANTPGSANIEAYARIVREKAAKRRKLEKRAASLVR